VILSVRLSEIHPVLYHIRVAQKRITRHIFNLFNYRKLAKTKRIEMLEFKLYKHESLLRRRLGNSSPILQENKIVNLGLALPKIDGVIIKPGEIFSFWYLVGKTTKKKGYIEGLQLSKGELKTGIGGGLCQLSNLIYWMALHTPLEVIERHHHSFDPFPDERRTLPFGSGASVFYNYIDLRLYNPTNETFQIKLWLTEEHLNGAIYSNHDYLYSYHIEERKHRFLVKNGKNFRANEIWRITIDKATGDKVKEEFLIGNLSEVKYEVPIEISDNIAYM